MNEDRLSLEEFEARFQTEEDCTDYLYQVKWPNGYRCPRCGHNHAYRLTSRRLPLFECASCHYQASLIVGTVMEGSRTELRKWFLAFFLISSPTHGINAKQLEKKIDVTYKTAYTILQKIRHAMSEEDASNPLSGSIYVNHAQYNRVSGRKCNLFKNDNPLFIGASMKDEQEPEYVKLKLVAKEHVKSSRYLSYILRSGQEDFRQNHIESYPAKVEFARRGAFGRQKKLFSLTKELTRWIRRTFRSLGRRHIQAYLNEFCYRVNKQLQNKPIFESLVQLCATTKKVTYRDITQSWIPIYR